MHSIYARVNSVSAFWSTCVMVLLGAVALSSFLFNADPKGNLDIVSLKVFHSKTRRYPFKNEEIGFVKFNLSADLTPLFNWNTKQLFVYLEAEYTNAQGVNNTVVVWDRIVRRQEDATIDIVQKDKYRLRDLSGSFSNVLSAQYSLKYNVMPYVGVLSYGEAARTVEPIDFPEARDAVS
ncbi:signal peptidase 22 kDa subunit [Suillus subaureus]|uniref:Signal peptidase subunit 3 n=1 Tax=Suillus subaureus TaxID=48587 RepID=A0A9P7E6N4_9AGAM|nr:signal peptidase 22 kDa subunit [Suillus subaureus]KAG1812225.1 signal peptidase 22 kDa subunit [Suillus subaureus]